MTINVNIPIGWNALKPRQLKKIAVLLHANITGVFFDYKIFTTLLNIRWWDIYGKWKALRIINNMGFSALKTHYNWFYTSLDLTTFIPSIKLGKRVYYSPFARLYNITADEFSHADDLYLGWHKTQDFEYLHYLAAVLYRELDVYNKRTPFDKTELDARAKLFKEVDKPTLLSIVLSYQGCRTYIQGQFPFVFPKPKETAVKIQPATGFGKVVLHLSGGKFGTHNETKNTNVYIFLSEFEEQLKTKPHA